MRSKWVPLVSVAVAIGHGQQAGAVTPGPGVDMSDMSLLRAQLFNMDLHGAKFDRSDCVYATFDRSDLTAATFISSRLTFADFIGSKLVGASFANADMGYVSFNDADLTGADLHGARALYDGFFQAKLPRANLEGTDLSYGYFRSTDLSGASLRGARLSYADCFDAKFTGADLSGAKLLYLFQQNTDFRSANLSAADLSYADLTGANLAGSDVSDARFGFATIAGINLSDARGLTPVQVAATRSYRDKTLTGINFTRANLTDGEFAGQNFGASTFTSVNFTRANLAGADFTGANLAGANFDDADSRGATHLSNGWNANARNVILPDGSVAGLAVTAGEVFRVRNNAIPIRVDGSGSIDAAGTMQFWLSANWASPVTWGVGVTPQLGGTLDLEFAPGVTPKTLVGTTFHLFSWPGPVWPYGGFDAVKTMPDVSWDLSQLYLSGDVMLIAVPEPAEVAWAIAVAAAFGGRARGRRSTSRRAVLDSVWRA